MRSDAPIDAPAPDPDGSSSPVTSRKRTLIGVGLAVLSAVLLAGVWPQTANAWPLALIGFVPALIAQYRFLPRRIAAVAIGVATFGYWLPGTLSYASVVGVAGSIGVALLALVLWSVIPAYERRFSERTQYRWFLIQFPLLWTLFEIVAGHNPIMGSAFWLPYRAASTPELIQPVSLVPTPAMAFLILMVNTTVALWMLRWLDRRFPNLAGGYPVPPRTPRVATVVTVPLVVTWLVASAVIGAQVAATMGPTVRVAALLTGAEDGIRFDGDPKYANDPRGYSIQGTPEDIARNERLKALLSAQTRDAAEQGAVLVVWPEETLGYDIVGPAGEWIEALAEETNTTIVVGFMPESPAPTSPNYAGVVTPDGGLQPDLYFKKHPVIVQGERFTSDDKYPTWALPGTNAQLGAIICFDHDFPDTAPRGIVNAGATIVAVPSLDPRGAENLRWQSLVFNAVANRVPMVKSDIAYDAAIVNPDGEILAQTANKTEYGSAGVLVADVRIGPADAPFTRLGSLWLTAIVLAGFAARVVAQIVLARRDRPLPR